MESRVSISLSSKRVPMMRPSAMNSANRHGPARSPAALLTPSSVSIRAEAHWLTASSHAPAQIISRNSSQNIHEARSDRTGSFRSAPSASSDGMGDFANKTAFAAGSSAQIHARTRQL